MIRGLKLSADKTVAISTPSSRENDRGTKRAFENNLTTQWPMAWHMPAHSVSEYVKSCAAYILEAA